MRSNALNHTVFDSASLPLVEATFAQFQANPASVTPEWQAYFTGWLAANGSTQGAEAQATPLALNVFRMVQAYREKGHTAAHLNPLEQAPQLPETLQLSAFGLTEANLQEPVPTFGTLPQDTAPLAEIWKALQRTYTGTTGIEIAAITQPAQRTWVQQWWENTANHAPAPARTRAALLRGLVQANGLEKFLHTKFVGAKRFSVEGTDIIIPGLQQLTQIAGAEGIRHMVLGMAHRGRLNVLINILHKSMAELFAAFADKLTTEAAGGVAGRAGDVKYHLGKTYVQKTESGAEVELELLFNPSHLEAVNPAVLGAARAKAVRDGLPFTQILPILIHGDSAVIGQGVVAETNNLSQLPAYTVGGTLHVVLNNQVGFTGNPADVVSGAPQGAYCTDTFKSIGIPIVHVNADDADAVWRAFQFAFAFRQKFGTDVALDVIGYRRWGHNEGDDPTFTQPLLYEKIRPHPTPDAVYAAKLVAEGVLTQASADALTADYTAELNAAFTKAQAGITVKAKGKAAKSGDVNTAVSQAALNKVADAYAAVPQGVVVNTKVQKVLDDRMEALRGKGNLNWGAAETAAYGTLLQEGIGWRLTGQDVQRGTFSHRHAALVCQRTNNVWSPLESLAKNGAKAEVMNSALSENAVLGFEYGYSLIQPTSPKPTLTCWEAQFGDFANGAQVVIDQFLASGEVKWGIQTPLTVMLPHGYEGQGPEHSSARVERFLQLCAEDNLRVAMPSTPAQMFHLLRRQALSPVAKPLIVFTPKSLLRHPQAVSPATALTQGGFQSVIADDLTDKKKVKRVALCSGKVYYDLLAYRTQNKRDDVALIRVEELYPWPAAALAQALEGYKVKDVIWVQEEPRNMGAWSHVREYWNSAWGYLHYVGRPASATPAAGTTAMHTAEQTALITEVFAS